MPNKPYFFEQVHRQRAAIDWDELCLMPWMTLMGRSVRRASSPTPLGPLINTSRIRGSDLGEFLQYLPVFSTLTNEEFSP